MGLINCPECNHEISKEAKTCPSCGIPLKKGKKKWPLSRKILVWILAGILGVILGTSSMAWISGRSNPVKTLAQYTSLANETIQLSEGEVWNYGFKLNYKARVNVNVTANPAKVHVMLMRTDQWEKYKKARGSLFGGNDYSYMGALSKQSVLKMTETAVLPKDTWRIVIERPHESLILNQKTNVRISIKAKPLL